MIYYSDVKKIENVDILICSLVFVCIICLLNMESHRNPLSTNHEADDFKVSAYDPPDNLECPELWSASLTRQSCLGRTILFKGRNSFPACCTGRMDRTVSVLDKFGYRIRFPLDNKFLYPRVHLGCAIDFAEGRRLENQDGKTRFWFFVNSVKYEGYVNVNGVPTTH
jgi:hypothetical protein